MTRNLPLILAGVALVAQTGPTPNRTPGGQIDPCPQLSTVNMFVVKVAGSHNLGCAAFPPGTAFSAPVNGIVTVLLPPAPAGPQGPPGPMGGTSPVLVSSFALGAGVTNSFPVPPVLPSVNPAHVLVLRNGLALNPPNVPPPSVPAFSVASVPITTTPSGFAVVLSEPPTADDNTLVIEAWQ